MATRNGSSLLTSSGLQCKPKRNSITIGIIGSGAIGTALARTLTRAGIEGTISNSRGADSLKELARELGPVIKAGTREDGARADIVFLDVNWTKIRTQPRTRKPRGLVDRRGGSILAGHLQQLGFFWRDYPVGEVDSDAFEAMPREFAVKAEPRSEMTPEAFLRKSLRRLYQPLGGAQPELELGRAYARACARVMGF